MTRAIYSAIALVAVFFLTAIGKSDEPPCPACQHKDQHKEEAKHKHKEVAGRADVMRHLPKKFASFEGYSAKDHSVTLHIEGEKKATTWKIKPNAEIKVHGWWGRPEQLHKGDRVWVWFAMDRSKKPTGVLMLADEISELDIHNLPPTVKEVNKEEGTITTINKRDQKRTLKLPAELADVKAGSKVYLQTAGGTVRLLWNAEQLDEARNKQKDYLREVWRKDGLPGMISFLHPLGGEMEVMLDHEAMRWGRYLKNGDKITLVLADAMGKPVKASVRRVEAWREHTRLLLVSNSGIDQLDLHPGQRIHALVSEPPKEVQQSHLPTDLDRPRSREERLDWFISSVYCTCRIAGDRCTGMFYTLASCNQHGCHQPMMTRKQIAKLIDEGLTDQQIFERLLKSHGPQLLQPHLLQ